MSRYWIVKNTVNTTEYVRNGYAAIGWSNCYFNPHDIEVSINDIEDKYGSLSGRSKGVIRRFLSIAEGDVVIVPCYKGFYIGRATGEYRHLQEYVDPDDRANVMVVDFEKDGDEPRYFSREGINTALSTKIGSRHLLLEIYDEKLQNEVEVLIKEGQSGSITNRIHNLENVELDRLKNKISEILKDYSKTWLDAHGVGFEELIAKLFEIEGYETHILPKNAGGSERADADILAIRRSKLSPKLNEVIYIQAKHHSGTTGIWGYKQIEDFKHLIEENAKENDGVPSINGNNGKVDIDVDHIKYVLISSAKITQEAYEENERRKEKEEIILIDGEDLSGMIVGHIEELDSMILSNLGLIRNYIHIDDYKTRE